MADLEELNLRTRPELMAMASGLGAMVKNTMKKPALVKLVYDMQQPEQPVVDEQEVDEATDDDGFAEVAVAAPIESFTDDELKAELDALSSYNLFYQKSGNTVKLSCGSKITTVNLSAPKNAVLSVAKRLCGAH